MDPLGLLHHARSLAAGGQDEAARRTYLALLSRDPSHGPALVELGALAAAGGLRSAARTAWREAVRLDPGETVARTGLANLAREDGDLTTARSLYETVLAIDPNYPPAHQGLAQILAAAGDPAAEDHWRAGYDGQAIVRRRFLGQGTGIPLLMLVSGRGGNVPTAGWIDPKVFAVTEICADFLDPAARLPPHGLIVNAIGDADWCQTALAHAERLTGTTRAPIINPPGRVRETARLDNARRLGAIPGVIAPPIQEIGQTTPATGLTFPLLLRSPGFDTGQNFVRVETADGFAAAKRLLPGERLLAIGCLDARGADGMARKYRVLFIDGAMYPLHLAISADWKVHYFSAAMADRPDFREEERRFLTAMPEVLGPRAMTALAGIQRRLGLDYAGIDFALAPGGSVLLFEANATMVINPIGPEPVWDYRRPAAEAARAAAARMVQSRADQVSRAISSGV